MHITVCKDNPSVRLRHNCHTIYAYAVQVVLAIKDTQLAVVHVREAKLVLMLGEVRNIISILVTTIQDTVEHNNLLNAVQRVLVRKTVPRRFSNYAFTAKRVQISLHGIIRRSKHRIMSTGRQQLLQRRLRIRTQGYLAKQAQILAIVFLALQILSNSLALKNIS